MLVLQFMSCPSKQFVRFDHEEKLLHELLRDRTLHQAIYSSLKEIEFTESLCDLVWRYLDHTLSEKMTSFKNQQIRADIKDAAECIGFRQNNRGYRAIQHNAALYAINLPTLRLSRYRNHWTEQVLFVNSDPSHVYWKLMSGDEYEQMQLGVKCIHREYPHLCGEWIWIDKTLWLSTAPFDKKYGMFKYKEMVQQRNGKWQRWMQPADAIHPSIWS